MNCSNRDTKRFTQDLLTRYRKHHAVMEAYLKHDRPVEWYEWDTGVWVRTEVPLWESDIDYRIAEEDEV